MPRSLDHIAGGHRRIGYLGDHPGIFTARERHYHGYRSAMSAAGLPIASSWVAMGTPTTGSVRGVLEGMVAGPEQVTAIFCGNNRISAIALPVLAEPRQAVAMVAATQRPTQKAMGQGAVRSQMDVRISFRVRERKDVDLILGQGMLAAGWQADTLNAPASSSSP